VARSAVLLLAVLLVGVGIVAAGTPGRGAVGVDPAEILNRVPHQVDAGTFPPITVAQDVSDWDHEIAGSGAQAIALTLAENLEVEAWALLHRDASILPAVDHGDRLAALQAQLEGAGSGETSVPHYTFDRLAMHLIEPFGVQSGLSLGVQASGTVTTETYDADGTLVASESEPYEQTFVMRRATGDRWLNVGVLPAEDTD
jgi:hypothetical protein